MKTTTTTTGQMAAYQIITMDDVMVSQGGTSEGFDWGEMIDAEEMNWDSETLEWVHPSDSIIPDGFDCVNDIVELDWNSVEELCAAIVTASEIKGCTEIYLMIAAANRITILRDAMVRDGYLTLEQWYKEDHRGNWTPYTLNDIDEGHGLSDDELEMFVDAIDQAFGPTAAVMQRSAFGLKK